MFEMRQLQHQNTALSQIRNLRGRKGRDKKGRDSMAKRGRNGWNEGEGRVAEVGKFDGNIGEFAPTLDVRVGRIFNGSGSTFGFKHR